MSRESSFNIITGQVKKDLPLNSTSKRFASLSEIKRAKQHGQYKQPMPQIRRLGTSSDNKAFNYNYKGQGKAESKLTKTISNLETTNRTSLINASKLAFNIINHSEVSAPQQKWNNTKKIGPLSKAAHMGRINAPNYSKQFAEKINNNATDFHRQRSACTQICHIQKSYGVEKFFRKYK